MLTLKKLSCPEAGKWYKNEAKSDTNHDLLHILMAWAATVLFFEFCSLEKTSVLLTGTDHYQYGHFPIGVLHA